MTDSQGESAMHTMPQSLDWEAILAFQQEEIDDLTSTVGSLRARLERQEKLMARLLRTDGAALSQPMPEHGRA
jgi:hypothetical protein